MKCDYTSRIGVRKKSLLKRVLQIVSKNFLNYIKSFLTALCCSSVSNVCLLSLLHSFGFIGLRKSTQSKEWSLILNNKVIVLTFIVRYYITLQAHRDASIKKNLLQFSRMSLNAWPNFYGFICYFNDIFNRNWTKNFVANYLLLVI